MSTSYEGRQSAELPVELSDRFELVVNLKTPAGAGLTISASILLRAGEVIETSFHERTLLHMLRSQSGTSRQAPHGRNCISPTFDRTVAGERPASVYRSRPCSNAIRDGFWVADHVSYVGKQRLRPGALRNAAAEYRWLSRHRGR
jgi:hypothetical protein